MPNIIVTRYPEGDAGDWTGYIEPEDRSWIVFVKNDGFISPWRRDMETGRVVPLEQAA